MPPKESEAAAYATTSEIDFYQILSIPTDAVSDSVLRKAFRKQSLLWHPDKNQAPDAPEKFHLLTVAYDVLSDPAAKAAYDNARAARLGKKRRSEAFDLNRRKMQEELETRENRAKRARVDSENEEEKFKSQLVKLQEEGAKLRHRREELLRAVANDGEGRDLDKKPDLKSPISRFSELDRTISVRWRQKGNGERIGEEELRNLFGRFGKVQECVVTKNGEKEKKIRNGLIVFESIVGAHSAVRDALGSSGFESFKHVKWASGKEPDIASTFNKSTPVPTSIPERGETTTATPQSPSQSSPRIWVPPLSTPKGGLKRVPSFASFTGTPKNLPFSKIEISESPDYESITLMRMRDAEKERLEVEIRRHGDEGLISSEDKF
ncbi:hypothetical protein EDC01DRAFT_648761 [Geopyxis carbonaria]|nr:hypothetical protein EDC01DRAFT_648761 [Geopyxis carbonaria]